MAQVVILNDITQSGDEIGYSRTIGPYVLAAKIRNAGYSCVVIDRFTYLSDLNSILEKIVDDQTVLIGISGTFLGVRTQPGSVKKNGLSTEYSEGFLWYSERSDLMDFLSSIRNLIKRKKSKAKLVLGGGKALRAVQAQHIHSAFDFFVIGKAESFIVEIIRRLESDSTLPFSFYHDTPFLAEESFQTETSTIESILWQPSDTVLKGESLPIEIAKGCSYNCKFCHFDKQGSIRQDVGKLREQIIRNYEMFGTAVYYFCDDCFNDTRAKVETICAELMRLPFKIEWVSFVRVDVAVKFPETLDLMVESGARGLYWGLETFDHKVGKSIGKGSDPDKIKEMLIRLKTIYKDRVLSAGSFIVGLPGETEESLWQTNRWLTESRALDDVSYFVLALVPYSEKFDKVAIDYAEFSKNPGKFGFRKITFDPLYWDHEIMDRTRALELRTSLMRNLQEHGVRISYAQSVFQYPYFRSLGLTHEEIVEIYKRHKWGQQSHHSIMERERNWRRKYENSLRQSLDIPELP